MVDDEGLDRTAAALELEAEAIHHAENPGDHLVIVGIIGRQIIVVRASDSRLVQDGPFFHEANRIAVQADLPTC